MAKNIRGEREYKKVFNLGGKCYLCGASATKRCDNCGRKICDAHAKMVVGSGGHLSGFKCSYCFRAGGVV